MKSILSASYKTKNVIVFFLLLLSSGINALDQSIQYFNDGNIAYKSKQYEDAIESYSKILAMGNENSILYYNLGNAFYRLKNYPEAILNYEKALKLSPGNQDAKYNLALANSKIVDKIEVVPKIFYQRWWNGFLDVMSINTYALLTLLFLSFSMLFWGIYLMNSKKTMRVISSWTAGSFLFFFIILLAATDQKKKDVLNSHEAIVLTPTLNVKSSPDETSNDVFVIHEGTKVILLDTIAGWQEIKIANGSVGWILKSELKKI
jgi:tetratricopeptide (TPR) repeat protein